MHRDAVISACGKFRYRLTRLWDASLPKLLFVMLNPSTADAEFDDRTVMKCVGFSRRLGYGGITIVNLFAYRATDPRDLKASGYQVGPENNRYVRDAIESHMSLVFAWGAIGGRKACQMQVGTMRYIAKNAKRTPMALRMSDGIPHHPLMLPWICTKTMVDFEREYQAMEEEI